MLVNRNSNYQPVMLNFVQPKVANPIGGNDFHYDYKKQTTVCLDGSQPGYTRHRLDSGTVIIDN